MLIHLVYYFEGPAHSTRLLFAATSSLAEEAAVPPSGEGEFSSEMLRWPTPPTWTRQKNTTALSLSLFRCYALGGEIIFSSFTPMLYIYICMYSSVWKREWPGGGRQLAFFGREGGDGRGRVFMEHKRVLVHLLRKSRWLPYGVGG